MPSCYVWQRTPRFREWNCRHIRVGEHCVFYHSMCTTKESPVRSLTPPRRLHCLFPIFHHQLDLIKERVLQKGTKNLVRNISFPGYLRVWDGVLYLRFRMLSSMKSVNWASPSAPGHLLPWRIWLRGLDWHMFIHTSDSYSQAFLAAEEFGGLLSPHSKSMSCPLWTPPSSSRLPGRRRAGGVGMHLLEPAGYWTPAHL